MGGCYECITGDTEWLREEVRGEGGGGGGGEPPDWSQKASPGERVS